MDTRPALVGMALTAACFIKPDEPVGQRDANVDTQGSPDTMLGSGTNLAFVTSRADIDVSQLSSLADLDAICTSLAGSGTFVAWYSIVGTPAYQRLGSANGWVRKDGRAFVDTVADL